MQTRDIEIRLTPDETGTIAGYAAVFNVADSFGDTLLPGAFARSLERHRAEGTRPLMLWSHDPAQPIGVWHSVAEDARGLRVSGSLVLDATAGRDAYALLRAGAIDGLSIGFRTSRASANPKGGRRVEAVELIEISMVARPAQGAARVTSVRSEPVAAGLAAFIRGCAARLRGK
jgi:hypothetical protein